MDDNYFDSLFNEGNLPLPEFLNQIDSYPQSPFAGPDLHLESINPIFDSVQIEEDKKQFEIESIVLNESEFGIGKAKMKAASKKDNKLLKEKDHKETKAEKNKRYAKESRDRKKKYIETLEDQVKILTREVEIYKNKLKNDNTTIVNIVLSFPMRVSMWMAEKNINIKNSKEIIKILSPIINLEEAELLAQHECSYDPDGKLNQVYNEKVNNFAKKIKKELTKFIKTQKNIIHVLKEINGFLEDPSYVTPFVLEIWAKIILHLSTKQEVRDFGISNLFDKLILDDK